MQKVLQLRLEQTSGERKASDKKSTIGFKLNKFNDSQLKKRRKNQEKERSFAEEMIRPCLCDASWHRSCIREYIVKAELNACPICQFQYTVGYTDCFAMFNKKRPNYLWYMFG